MKLLVSPINLREAKTAIKGGADIIDVKNPKEGSLGANFPWVIKEIKEALPSRVELSATLGDLDFKPGTASLAAYGLANLGVDYIKAGFFGVHSEKQALKMADSICKAVERFECRVVLAGYGDFKSIGSIDPFLLSNIAYKCSAFGVMIDTAIKRGKTLIDHISLDALSEFIKTAHELGLKVALAGSLKGEEIKELAKIKPDVIGVRGAVCTNNDRVKGEISLEKVKRLKAMLRGY
jgi:hypothetical protein